MSIFTRYFAVWLALSSASLGGLALFNLVIDPFGAYRLVETPVSPWRYLKTRSGKAELLRHLDCQDVLVGTSRVEVGIDPRNDAFEGRTVCNAGLANTSMLEVAEMMRVALEQPATERIFLFLDFMLFSSARGAVNDFAQSRLAPGRSALDYHVGTLLSWYATGKSLRMLSFRRKGTPPPYDELGHRVGGPLRTDSLAREPFRRSLHSFLDGIYDRFVYGPEQVERLRQVIGQSLQRGVEIVIVIPPVHALQLEAIEATGLWETFESWKRDLTSLAVLASPEAPIPVWDFTGYAPYNRVPVPDEAALATDTPWFWESSHFKVALGNLVLARAVAGNGDPGFGERLTPSGLEAHLTRLRADRQRYHEAQPEDLAFFEEVWKAEGAP